MSEPQTSRFWQGALRSGLIDAVGLRKCWDQIPEVKRTDDAIDRRLARQTIELGMLTLWQAQQILSGRTAGFQVDRYVLLSLIGQGGMGRVYLARDTRLNRRVALKVLSPERMNNPRAIARFQREARVGAQLQHENLVRIYDEGEANGRCYLVMEFIEGRTIGKHIHEHGPYSAQEASRLVRLVALGLEHARQKGLIHRDVNPWNILVTPEGIAKLTDLGLAIDLADEAEAVTRDGATVGTFDYISPEQARHSHSVDTRSDIYSLGCTLYHMITAQVPFAVPSLPEKLYAHQVTEPKPMETLVPGVPRDLEVVVQRMMRKDPADRFSTPLEVAQALEPLIAGEDDTKKSAGGTGSVTIESPALPGSGWHLPTDSPTNDVGRSASTPGLDWSLINTSTPKPILQESASKETAAVAQKTATEKRGGPDSNQAPLPAKPQTTDKGPSPAPTTQRREDEFVWPTELPLGSKAGSGSDGLGLAALLDFRPVPANGTQQRSAVPTPSSTVSKSSTVVPGTPTSTNYGAKTEVAPNTPKPADSAQPEAAAEPNPPRPPDPEAEERRKQYMIIGAATLCTVVAAVALIAGLQYWRGIEKPVDSSSNLKELQNEEPEKKGPALPLTVVFSDGAEQEVKDLAEGFAITGRGSAQIVLGPKADVHPQIKTTLNVPAETLSIRSSKDASPVLRVDLAGSEPFVTVSPEGRLVVQDLTIEIEYSGKPEKCPPVFYVAGELVLRNCIFKATTPRPGSLLVAGEGRRIEVQNCWIQGFDHALDLKLLGEARADIKNSLLVGDRAFGGNQSWLVRAQYSGSPAKGKTRRLDIQQSTLVGASILLLEDFAADGPLHVEFGSSLVYAKTFLLWKSPANLDRQSLDWNGKLNVYGIDPGPWIDGPADAPNDGPKWLAFTSEQQSRIENPQGFAEAVAKLSESIQAADFPAIGEGPARIGADPGSLGPAGQPR